MATTNSKTKRNRTFIKQSYDLATHKNDKHTHFNKDNTLKLKANINTASMYRYPYSSTTTPITSSLTPGTSIFRVSIQEMRNRKNKRPKLQQSQTYNYYNVTNSSLPHSSPIHHYSHSNITQRDQGSDTETEDGSIVMTDAYSQYKPTGSFPDTFTDPIHNETSTDNNNWWDKFEKMESKMRKLEQQLAVKNKKIDDLAYKLNNNNIAICADYSDDEDGDITDEGETEYDDDDEQDINIEIKKKKYTKQQRESGWIEKKPGNMYGSNRNSNVLEIKMSELFEQTAEKFLAFLKQDELQKAAEANEKEQIMLDLHDKVKENDTLKEENKKLIQHNKKREEEVICLKKQILHLQQQLNRNKITMAEQKETIHNFRVAQIENDTSSQYQQYYHEQQYSSNVHKRSATENVSIDINRVFSAIADGTDNNNNNNKDTLSAPKFLRAHSIGPDAPTKLKEHEMELYELLKSFIETHKTQNTSSLQLPNYNNYSSALTEDDDIKEKNEEEEEHIFDENEIMSFDNLDTPRSFNANCSETSNQSISSTQLTMDDDTVSNDDTDFTKDVDGNEYKLNNMDNNNNNDDIDGSSQPNINRLKSVSYWKHRMDQQLQSSRHKLTVSRQNIENGIVHRLKRQFDPTAPSSSEQYDISNLSLAISNLPDKPEELIRDLSNKTNLAITSTHRRRTTKPKHKHKRKAKNAKSNILDDDDANNSNHNNHNHHNGYNEGDKNSKTPKFAKDTSCRDMNKQNSERCKNVKAKTSRKNTLDDDESNNSNHNGYNGDNKNIKKPKFRKDISWRETMNKQNNERCKNLKKRTPRNSLKYIDGAKGKIHIKKSSLSKITGLLRRQYKYNGNKKQKD